MTTHKDRPHDLRELSERLKNWRAERPDEWVMDEFIRLAQAYEGRIQRLQDDVTTAWQAEREWHGLFERLAIAIGCLPSSFSDQQGHVFYRAAQLYASPVTPAAQADVADICNAYESGVGHRGRRTASINPYAAGTPEHEAYAIGASGKPAAQTVAVPDVQVTTTVDAIDAGDHEFIDVLAARVGMRGKVEHKRFEQSDGGVIVLWDGPNLGAVALTVRDDFNRTKCMTVNLLSAPATPAKVEATPGDRLAAEFSVRIAVLSEQIIDAKNIAWMIAERIEACGASEELTAASSLAFDLHTALSGNDAVWEKLRAMLSAALAKATPASPPSLSC